MSRITIDRLTLTPGVAQRVVNAISAQHNIKVKESNHWGADIKNKILFFNAEQATMFDSHEALLACILHEVSHIKYTTDIDTSSDIYKECPQTSLAGINLLEDIRMDYLVGGEYTNGANIMHELHRQAVDYGKALLEDRIDNKIEQQSIDVIKDVKNICYRYALSVKDSNKDSNWFNDEWKQGNGESITDAVKRLSQAKMDDVQGIIQSHGGISYDVVAYLEDMVEDIGGQFEQDYKEKLGKLKKSAGMLDSYATSNWKDWFKKKRSKFDNNEDEEGDLKVDAIDILLGAYITYYGGYVSTHNTHFKKKDVDVIEAVADAIYTMPETAQSTQQVQDIFETVVYPLIKEYIDPQEEHKREFMEKYAQLGGNLNHEAEQELSNQSGDASPDFSSLGKVKDWRALNEKTDVTNQSQGGNGRQDLDTCQGHSKIIQGAQSQVPQNGDSQRLVNTIKKSENSKGYSNYQDKDHLWLSYADAKRAIQKYLSGGYSQLQRILRDNQFDRQGGRHRSGELKKRGLYKLRIDDTRLFTRKQEKENKFYAFSIVVDVSGSMQGTMAQGALRSTVLLSEIIQKLGLPYEIRFFSDDHTDAKRFNEKLLPHIYDKALSRVNGGGTRIVYPIEDAVKALVKEGTDKTQRILIVMTDGDVNSDEGNRIQRLVTQDKKRHIQVYGIGIQGVRLDHVVGKENALRVNNEQDIMKTFTSILKKHIVKG